jgi:hypothetical protein
MANLLFYTNDPNRNKIAVENPKGRRKFGDLGIDVRIILRCILTICSPQCSGM